jgi:hypothetical protein
MKAMAKDETHQSSYAHMRKPNQYLLINGNTNKTEELHETDWVADPPNPQQDMQPLLKALKEKSYKKRIQKNHRYLQLGSGLPTN